jgi:opacity protein-like surface antigen
MLGALWTSTAPVSAQGFGVGARIAWVNADTEVDVDAVRYFGGQVRLTAGRIGVELSLDRHAESSETLDVNVTDTPIQASLLWRGGGKVSPFVLAGPGWYRRKVERLDGLSDLDSSTTEFGWHAGAGLEILATKHFGIHGDYRYTFLDFSDDEDGDDDEEDESFIGRFLPGHRGSMWTLGATFYF